MEPIEAWVRGPVVRSVWKEYNRFAWRPISDAVGEPNLTKNVKAHLDEVLGAYGDHSAFTLEQLTHKETPWIKTRGDLAPSANCNRQIPTEEIHSYFKKLASRKN